MQRLVLKKGETLMVHVQVGVLLEMRPQKFKTGLN